MILAVPFVVALIFTIYAAHKDASVAVREQKAEGVVTVCEPSNHNQCRYRFMFLGRSVEGISGWVGDSPSVGQHVTVFFDPEDPETSSLEDYGASSRRERGFAPICMLGILTVVVIIASSKLRHHRLGR
jgi:hypothetical protein